MRARERRRMHGSRGRRGRAHPVWKGAWDASELRRNSGIGYCAIQPLEDQAGELPMGWVRNKTPKELPLSQANPFDSCECSQQFCCVDSLIDVSANLQIGICIKADYW